MGRLCHKGHNQPQPTGVGWARAANQNPSLHSLYSVTSSPDTTNHSPLDWPVKNRQVGWARAAHQALSHRHVPSDSVTPPSRETPPTTAIEHYWHTGTVSYQSPTYTRIICDPNAINRINHKLINKYIKQVYLSITTLFGTLAAQPHRPERVQKHKSIS